MILQAREDIGKPSVSIDVIEYGTLDQRVDRGSPVAAFVGAREGPIVATHGNGANLPLGRIVGHAHPTIVEEACECHPSGEAVGNGLYRSCSVRRAWRVARATKSPTRPGAGDCARCAPA